VRVRVGGDWHTGIATALPAHNCAMVRLTDTDLLTSRIELA